MGTSSLCACKLGSFFDSRGRKLFLLNKSIEQKKFNAFCAPSTSVTQSPGKVAEGQVKQA